MHSEVERVIIHSNAPHLPSGYGQQAGFLALQLTKLGYKVAISAFCGMLGARSVWNGIPVLPQGMTAYGEDVIADNAAEWEADLVITLMDACVLPPDLMRDLGAVHWLPVDCSPLSVLDQDAYQKSGASIIAMSRFGEKTLTEAGFAPYFVPHGIPTKVFSPGDGDPVRERLGVPADAFLIGINAANADSKDRKALVAQLCAFALFRQAHPDALLMMHSTAPGPGLNLNAVTWRLGIGEAIRWSSRPKITKNQFTPADMADWYRALGGTGGGVLSGAAKGEGFGLPLIEAQACGIPVVTTEASAMTENCGSGWLVHGSEPEFHDGHLSWWAVPHVMELVERYEEAWEARHDRSYGEKARDFALGFDMEALIPKWDEVMGMLAAERA